MSENLPKPMGLYPMTRKVGSILFVSGIGPREAGTDNIPGLKLDKYGNYIEFDFLPLDFGYAGFNAIRVCQFAF